MLICLVVKLPTWIGNAWIFAKNRIAPLSKRPFGMVQGFWHFMSNDYFNIKAIGAKEINGKDFSVNIS